MRMTMVSGWFFKYDSYMRNSNMYRTILESSINSNMHRGIQLKLSDYNNKELLRLARAQYTSNYNIIIEHAIVTNKYWHWIGYQFTYNQLLYRVFDRCNGYISDAYDKSFLEDVSDIVNMVHFSEKILVLLKNDGKIYSLNNDTGIIDLITSRDKIMQVSSCNMYLLMITADNELYSWGKSDYVNLEDQSRPIKLPLSNVNGNLVQISVGSDFSILLTDTGYLYSILRKRRETDNNCIRLIYPIDNKPLSLGTIIKIQVSNMGIIILNSKGNIFVLNNANVNHIMSDMIDIISSKTITYMLNREGLVYKLFLKDVKSPETQRILNVPPIIKLYSSDINIYGLSCDNSICKLN